MLINRGKIRLGAMGYRLLARTQFSTTANLPPNLELPDMSILEPPKPSPVNPLNFLFPEKMENVKISVKNFTNPDSDTGEQFSLDPRVFGVAIRQDIIHQIVRYQRAAKRQPQCSKRIGDIRGSTRKLYQQKGTGRHRVGQARVPGRKGGAKAHGPVLRDFSFSLNRKMRAMGMMIAIAAKYREGNLVVYDSIRAEVRQPHVRMCHDHRRDVRLYMCLYLVSVCRRATRRKTSWHCCSSMDWRSPSLSSLMVMPLQHAHVP